MPATENFSRRDIGASEEARAADYFVRQGWKLMERNYQCRMGEIDLIFRDGDGTVVFVEVKYRSSANYGAAQAFVGPQKQNRLIKTALSYIKKYRLQKLNFRFDVAALTPEGIEHIPNAFPAGGYTL